MRRRLIVSVGLVAALIFGGVLLQRIPLEPPAPIRGEALAATAAPGGQSAPAVALSLQVTIETMTGQVQRRHADGNWTNLRVGDVLAPDDVIRTAKAATATLNLGGNVAVQVAEDTELTVGQVSETLSRIRLDDGRLASIVHGGGDGFRFRVEVRGADVVAESSDGEFGVLRRGESPVTVAAKNGKVRVSSQGSHVEVDAGEQTVVEPGTAPSAPSKIPSSLFLKLARGIPVRRGARHVQVSGSTSAGAAVRLGDARSAAGPSGRFSHRLVLRDGSNLIVVEVEDALGRRVRRALPLIRVSPKPVTAQPDPVNATVQW